MELGTISLRSERQAKQDCFECAHGDIDKMLFWYLGENTIGATTTFHQQALFVEPGKHKLTLIDTQGNMVA